MKVEILGSASAAARAAARRVAAAAREAVTARGRFVVAFSGGATPAAMWRSLAEDDLPWRSVFVLQVDERVAPAGHADRNLTALESNLLARAGIPAEQVFPMPVEAEHLDAAAFAYEATLAEAAGRPPVIDLVHLGIGDDGHTASLVPGDAVLDEEDRDVVVSAEYQGRRRMTLTFPILNRARERLWLVTGAAKAAALQRMLDGDRSIPASRISRERSVVYADRAAAGRAGKMGTVPIS